MTDHLDPAIAKFRIQNALSHLVRASEWLQDVLDIIAAASTTPAPENAPAARTGDVVGLSPHSDDPLPGEVVRLPTDRCFTCRKLRSEHPGGHFCFPGKGYRMLPPLGLDVSLGPLVQGERQSRCYSCGALSAHCVCPSQDPGF
jgi:hypothetical protein